MHNEINEQTKISFLVCPECAGSGEINGSKRCKNCHGIGTGAFYRGKFLYWGLNLKKDAIILRQLERWFHVLLNLLALAIGLSGFIVLGAWFYFYNGNIIDGGTFAFWKYKHLFVLIFWISILADMFVFYRLSEERAKSNRIPDEIIKKEISNGENNQKEDTSYDWAELRKRNIKINIADGFSREALETVEESVKIAEKLRNSRVRRMHLFYMSLGNRAVSAILSRLSVSAEDFIKKIRSQLFSIPQDHVFGDEIAIDIELKKILIGAYVEAVNFRQKKVESANFLLSAFNDDKNINDVLYDFEVDHDKLYNCLQWFRINDEMVENYKLYKKMARFKPSTNMDRAYTAVATPLLNHYSYDLTKQAKWGRLELCVAREGEMNKIFDRFITGHSGVILVGETGVGKNSIASGLAQLMVQENVPAVLKDKRLIELDIPRLVSGAGVAEAQERLLRVADEIARARNIILYIKGIESIIGIQAGEGESLDLSDVLSSSLEKNNFYCLASTNPASYSKYIEGTPIGELMAKVEVDEPETNIAIQIMESKVGYLENKYKVYFSYNAIEEAVKLSSRYMHEKFLPAKAIDILESVAIKVSKRKEKNSMVMKDDVAIVIGEATKIPIDKISRDEGEVLIHLEEKMHERMIGQEEAVKMVAASLRRARVEMRDTKRPIANFLFLGPTGVGKTELAKTVAEVYFGDEDAMIRLDMSEYQHHDSITKMIGEGESQLGYLTEAVRKAPFSLVLLDEFEKAHPDILNLFLQVMDDGRLTDGQGRTIDFTNSIIIATSNAGALYIEEEIVRGTDIESIKEILINEHLNKIMRPELINRFDGVVVFKPLTEENISSIARLLLKKIGKMLEAKGIGLKLNEDGIKILAREGYDPKFGARPLRRVLQERIENIVANKLLAGELARRDVVVINSEGNIEVEKGREL